MRLFCKCNTTLTACVHRSIRASLGCFVIEVSPEHDCRTPVARTRPPARFHLKSSQSSLSYHDARARVVSLINKLLEVHRLQPTVLGAGVAIARRHKCVDALVVGAYTPEKRV